MLNVASPFLVFAENVFIHLPFTMCAHKKHTSSKPRNFLSVLLSSLLGFASVGKLEKVSSCDEKLKAPLNVDTTKLLLSFLSHKVVVFSSTTFTT